MCESESLDCLLDKLGHTIHEIKCRALSNIHSKLNRGLLPSTDEFLTKITRSLLKWLEETPLLESKTVLDSLNQLLKVNGDIKSKIVLNDGLSILTQTRNRLTNSDLRKNVDEIFILIAGPEVVSSQNNAVTIANHISGYFNFSGSTILTSTSITSENFNNPKYSSCARITNFNNANNLDQSFSNSCTLPTTNKSHFLYFPTINLIQTDLSVLSSSLTSLKGDDNDAAFAGLLFFRDVILKDFPPEIFLQRTTIIQNILRFMKSNNIQFIYTASDCLLNLCTELIKRIYYHLDPNNFTNTTTPQVRFDAQATFLDPSQSLPNDSPNQIRSINESLIVHRGSRNSSNPVPTLMSGQTDPNSNLSLDISSQSLLSIPDLCFHVFSSISIGLETLINYHSQAMNELPQNPNALLNSTRYHHNDHHDCKYKSEAKLLHLMSVAIDLLLVSLFPHDEKKILNGASNSFSSVNYLVSHNVPTQDRINPNELPSSFTACLELFAYLLSLLSNGWSKIGLPQSTECWNCTDLMQFISTAFLPCEYERHIYIGLLNQVFRLISHLFTPETALAHLPTELKSQLSLALLDTTLLVRPNEANAEQPSGLAAYVYVFNSAIHSTWVLLSNLETSMLNLIQFLDTFNDTSDEQLHPQKMIESNLNTAFLAFDSLEITHSSRFTSQLVRFLSNFYIVHNPMPPSSMWRCQSMLVRLMSHNVVSVRRTTYTQILKITKNAVDPKFVANPNSSLDTMNFLLNDEVLSQWINFGLNDENKEIASMAKQALTHLLDSHELVSKHSWQTLQRLAYEPELGDSCFTFKTRPISISLGPYASTESSDQNPLGQIALQWCLGKMGLPNRCNSSPVKNSTHSTVESIEFRINQNVFASCCRILLHPSEEVRNQAAINIAEQFRTRRCRSSASGLSNSRIRFADGTSMGHRSRSIVSGGGGGGNVNSPISLKTTSTPIDERLEGDQILVANLKNCLIHPSSANRRSGLISSDEWLTSKFDHADSLEQVKSLLQVMEVLADPQADLTVRRAAGEQVAIMICDPSLLCAWRVHNGMSFLLEWISKTFTNLINSAESPNLDDPSVIPQNVAHHCLTSVVIRLARFAAIWDPQTRSDLASNGNLLSQLIYLRAMHQDGNGLHKNLTELIIVLLFSWVSQPSAENPYCLPTYVVSGYCLPFICPTYSFRTQLRDPSNNQGSWQNPFEPISDLINTLDGDEHTMLLANLIRRDVKYIWAMACHNGPTQFLKHTLATLDALPDSDIVDAAQIDHCNKYLREYSPCISQLSLSSQDLILLLVSHPSSSLLLSLSAVRRASNHLILLRSLGMLHRSVWAHYGSKSTLNTSAPPSCPYPPSSPSKLVISEPPKSNLDSSKWFWWIYADIGRFLTIIPSCSADYYLLASILGTIEELGLLCSHLQWCGFGHIQQLCPWLLNLLAETHGPLAHCLLQPKAGIGQTDSHRLIMAKQNLIYRRIPNLVLSLLEWLAVYLAQTADPGKWSKQKLAVEHLFRNQPVKEPNSPITIWFKSQELLLQWALSVLDEFISSPFSDLTKLHLLASCLTHLTSFLIGHEMIMQDFAWPLLKLTTNYLKLFDQARDNGYDAFMGSWTIRFLLSTINHLICYLSRSPCVSNLDLLGKDESHAEMEKKLSWLDEEWLIRLVTSRQHEIRAVVLSILSRICMLPTWIKRLSSHQLSKETQSLLSLRGLELPSSGGLWKLGFTILLDRNETCLVRNQASQLLINLSSSPINAKSSGIFLPPNNRLQSELNPQQPAPERVESELVQEDPSHETDGVDPVSDIATEPTQTSSQTDRLRPHGDLPTISSNPFMASESSSIDLRDLLNSDLSSDELRNNIAELYNLLEPWFRILPNHPNQSATGQNVPDHPTESNLDHQANDAPMTVRLTEPPQDLTLPTFLDASTNVSFEKSISDDGN